MYHGTQEAPKRSNTEAEVRGSIQEFPTGRVETLLQALSIARKGERFLRTTPYWKDETKTWKGIPKAPKTDKSMYSPIFDIVDSVIRHFGMAEERKAHKTFRSNKTSDTEQEFPKTMPTILITGNGPHLEGQINDATWAQCISAIEVTRASCINARISQLTLYAREVFIAQQTRLFLFSLLVTERDLTIFYFDRAGVQRSRPMNYRDDPMMLVQAILLVANKDSQSSGIDTSVTFVAGLRQFQLTRYKHPYILTEVSKRHQERDVVGRGTVCWTVRDKENRLFTLKQQFVALYRDALREGDLLKESKPIDGVVQLHHEESGSWISELRGSEPSEDYPFTDAILSRIVLENVGRSVLEVDSRVALLGGLRDVVAAHQKLWDKNILHRNVSGTSIFYPVDRESAKVGERAKLVDLDSATTFPKQPPSEYRIGTHQFLSTFVLLSSAEDSSKFWDYLDDLESFFWVLIWITMGEVSPEEKTRLAQDPSNGDIDEDISASQSNPGSIDIRSIMTSTDYEVGTGGKVDILHGHDKIQLKAGWGQAFIVLVRSLAKFFSEELKSKRSRYFGTNEIDMQYIREHASTHYQFVLELFDTALADLREEIEIEGLIRTSVQAPDGNFESVIPKSQDIVAQGEKEEDTKATKLANEAPALKRLREEEQQDSARDAHKRPRTLSVSEAQTEQDENGTIPVSMKLVQRPKKAGRKRQGGARLSSITND